MREIVRSSTRRLGPLFVAVAMVLALAGTALAGSGDRIEPTEPPPWELDASHGDGFVDDLWFVEFASEPRARGGSPAAHANERALLEAEARAEGISIDQRRDFDTLWNGLTVDAGISEIATIRSLPSVAAVHPVAIIEAPEPEGVSPELASALAMTGADNAQDLGLTGKSLSVGVIDTGIDYNHPDLGGGGDTELRILAEDDRTFDHPRISHAWDYVGEGFDAGDPDSPDPDPNPDPWDPHGHGTHVSGIVGAAADDEDGVTGVAPEVTFGAYKVFDAGSTTADIIVEALEDAYVDGMDIVNMSLGASLVWGQEYPTTATSNELAAQGVVVINSAGNSGGLGTWSLSAPANAHDIISVASADNEALPALTFEVDQLVEPIPYLDMSAAPEPPLTGESDPVMHLGDLEDDARFGCFESDFDDFEAGNVALISRGGVPDACTFATKYDNAVDAGATGVVIYNNVQGLFAGGGIVAEEGDPWAAAISDVDGARLVNLLEDDEDVRLRFTDNIVIAPSPTGGLVSSFSSYGQDVELAFGPSVMAPGGLITSTYPLDLGEYAMLSGTSMSAPHVAGAVALLLEAERDLDPFEVRDRLQNTAEPAVWSLNPDLGLLDHTFRQGAGMIQIDRAVTTEHRVAPGQIALGDDASSDVTITVWNDSEEEVTYTIGNVGTLGTGVSTFAPVFFGPGATVEATEDSVTVGAGETGEVVVTITAPGFGLPNHQFGGYVTLTPDVDDTPVLRVPYSGYDGDYQELPLFGYFAWPLDEPIQFVEQEPHLSEIVGFDEDGFAEFEPVDPGHVFVPREDDFPVIEAFFGHFPQVMEVYAVDQRRGTRHLVIQEEHLSRSPTPDFFWAFAWDGTAPTGQGGATRPLRSGTYTLEVEVLRTLGDPDIDDHWDTWESVEFQIDTRRGGPPAVPGPPPGRGGPR